MLALEDEKDKVWQLLEARRELVDGISHELRNPAAIIQGYSSALAQAWQDRPVEEVQHDLATIQYETARLQIILDDLLTASQAELGRLHVALRPVEVTALVRRVVETLAGLAWMSKRVQVTLTVPPQTIFALADPLRLEQALVNLVQNALRHTSPGGLVMLEVCPVLEQVCIEVEDTGEGILPEDLPHIWEKYYQSGSPQRRSGYGMGLGLSLVKELTEAMGGSVAVESWPGQGSLFQIHLPACGSVENTP
jgi:signal transduction histidine kinase